MTDQSKNLSEEALASLPELAPPEAFAEAVLSAREEIPKVEDEPAGRWSLPIGTRGAVVILAVAAVVMMLMWRSRPQFPGATGTVVTAARQTLKLGHRGVAVAEAGASLAWEIAASGAATVTQDDGNVFYRVEKGGPFAVRTPRGTVEVRGTSFRVEVDMVRKSKQGVVGAAVGAAVAAAVVVTVYEGKVVFSEPKDGATVTAEVGPGEVLSRGVDEKHRGESLVLEAPASDATREELLTRDESQRQEIRKLREKLAAIQEQGVRVREVRKPDGESSLSPSSDTLKAWAKECRVHFDMPPPSRHLGEPPLPDRIVEDMGLSAAEVEAVRKAMGSVQDAFALEVRELYLEATGNTDAADELSPESMANEIRDKSDPHDEARARARIARERAGLSKAPADLSKLSLMERYYRLLAGVGDAAENAIAEVLGAKRARDIRAKNDGWGRQMQMAGCDEEADEEVR
jgi:hypothetical protein